MKKPVSRLAISVSIGAFMAAWAGIMYIAAILLEWKGVTISDSVFNWFTGIGLGGFVIIILSLSAASIMGLIDEWEEKDETPK